MGVIFSGPIPVHIYVYTHAIREIHNENGVNASCYVYSMSHTFEPNRMKRVTSSRILHAAAREKSSNVEVESYVLYTERRRRKQRIGCH